ncbi:MAG TPA: MEDS domain-containing protein [Nitrososphaeraceae archaeon]|nr:MEDS domain-containing protein [Nitrososphaeraceae archaeon]
MTSAGSHRIESVMQWFENGIDEGENCILVYPNMQTFREIYMQYAKDQLVAREEQKENEDNNKDVHHDNNNRRKEQLLMPRIILIATFYDTVNAVKHNLSAVGVDVQSHIDDGSLLIVDAYDGYYPNINGMKMLVASLSERARKEGRIGVSVISNMGFFFLYDGDGDASELISYETSLPSKTDGGNVRGLSCYHTRDYENLDDSQKKELLTQGQKKSLEVTESAADVATFDA